MKFHSFLMTMIASFGFVAIAAAQSIVLTINKNASLVQNLTRTDAVDATGATVHTASFDIQLNNLPATKAVVLALQTLATSKTSLQAKAAASLSTVPLDLEFQMLDFNNNSLEDKVYSSVSIEEMKISALNASEKNTVVLSYKIKAKKVAALPTGQKIAPPSLKAAKALSSNYAITIGNLPTKRVSKLSEMIIRPSSNALVPFTIELAAIDGANWSQWFNTGAAGVKKEQGQIELLTPDFKSSILSIKLVDVQILSYSVSSATGGSISKSTVGLAAGAITIL
ncbi:MAG: hypothetical protein K2P88_00120 [Chitinophagaceae bacterium]|nr:hypothetical protein [Chitinophagaceae bacterium]